MFRPHVCVFPQNRRDPRMRGPYSRAVRAQAEDMAVEGGVDAVLRLDARGERRPADHCKRPPRDRNPQRPRPRLVTRAFRRTV